MVREGLFGHPVGIIKKIEPLKTALVNKTFAKNFVK